MTELLNLDDLASFGAVVPRPAVHLTTQVSSIQETVSITPSASPQSRSFAGIEAASWNWEQIRDYVIASIEARFGKFPRMKNRAAEAAIFKSFAERYGERAGMVARYAFEVEGGLWRGAPISVTRFCKGSDPFFGDIIAPRLVLDGEVKGW